MISSISSKILFLIEELVLAMAQNMTSLDNCLKVLLPTPIIFLTAFIPAPIKALLLEKVEKK